MISFYTYWHKTKAKYNRKYIKKKYRNSTKQLENRSSGRTKGGGMHWLARGGWNGAWLVAMGCWDAGEHNTEPRGGARLVEESRFSFEKSRSTNSGISRNATHSDRQRRAGEDGTVEAQSSWFGWKQQKTKQKTPKAGVKIEKRRERKRRETKSIPPPLKSLTQRGGNLTR